MTKSHPLKFYKIINKYQQLSVESTDDVEISLPVERDPGLTLPGEVAKGVGGMLRLRSKSSSCPMKLKLGAMLLFLLFTWS